ncbi:MAG: serine--tRNA ligase, partial [Deltaproteobacteria bacterium]|nr:serine--tRNA ligase [Deltaproteobacteria bacterium]
MLEIKFVRDNLAEVKNALSNRGGTADFEMFESSDAQRRTILFEIEELRHRRNVVSDKIAGMKKSGENADEL